MNNHQTFTNQKQVSQINPTEFPRIGYNWPREILIKTRSADWNQERIPIGFKSLF